MAGSAGEQLFRGAESSALEGRSPFEHDRAFLWVSALLFIASAAGTVWWCGSMSDGMPMPGNWTMSMAWMRMPGRSWPGAAASFLGMWVLMMAAMMMPSLVPMLSSYRRVALAVRGRRVGVLTALAGAGYFFVWFVVGASAYPLGVALASAEMRWEALARTVPLATGVVLLLAGCVQLTAWKARRLGSCRAAPCGRSDSADAPSAWRHGFRLGAHCALCCSGLMIVLLVTGVMDLRAMGVVAAAITAERLAPRPMLVARATGVIVVAAGVVMISRALGAA